MAGNGGQPLQAGRSQWLMAEARGKEPVSYNYKELDSVKYYVSVAKDTGPRRQSAQSEH